MNNKIKVKISKYSFYKRNGILNIKWNISIKLLFLAFIFCVFLITSVALSDNYNTYPFDSSTYKRYYYPLIISCFIFIFVAYFRYGYKYKLQNQKSSKNLIAIKEKNGKYIEKTILNGGHFFWDIKCNKRGCNHNLGECSAENTDKYRFQFTLRYFDNDKICQSFLLLDIGLSHTVSLKEAKKVFVLLENYPIILTDRARVICSINDIAEPKNAIILKNDNYKEFIDLYDYERYFHIVNKQLGIK